MSDLLSGLKRPDDPNLIVGFDTSDDAGVYKISSDIAMINTIDFITPPVDDPYWFGQIAAANSISDVYSMGGRPITALNVVMFPSKVLPMTLLKEILRGANDKVVEAGALIIGGHSVEDDEPKFGLSVNGVIHPDKVITNSNCKSGDSIVLTKRLGSGVLFNALRAGKISFDFMEKNVLNSLARLNDKAITTALKFDLHACTDVTGFGIAGHALEMSEGSQQKIRLFFSKLPFYEGSREMYKKGVTTLSNGANRRLSKDKLVYKIRLSESEEELLFDPQTSGGLLLSLPSNQAETLVKELSDSGVQSAIVGETYEEGTGIEIT
ncbi:MAG: selenide, water dikinase SelD [Proteobacteria bacterium]|nr:selenide, water dikinase SelD [Pseudomonadota bacterium]